MSEWKNGYYSIVQYCPDRSRMEAANVGVLLFCPALKFLDVKSAAGNDRIRKFFGAKHVDVRAVDQAKRAIQARVRSFGTAIQVHEDLVTFIESRANQLKLTAPRPVKVDAAEPSRTLDELFEELVGGRVRRKSAGRQYSDLDKIFKSDRLAGRVRFDEAVIVPVVGRQIVAPYAFTNGRVNLVVPEKFGGTDTQATNKALRLAAEGDLLLKHVDMRLIVPSLFADTVESKQRILDVFEDFNVRALDLSDPNQLLDLEEEVVRSAH